MTIGSPGPLDPFSTLLLGSAQQVLNLLIESGYHKVNEALRRVTDADLRELKQAFGRAWIQASAGDFEEGLKKLLAHKPFQEAVVVGLLDPQGGFDINAASEGWIKKYPQYADRFKAFFDKLEELLLGDALWGSRLRAAREHVKPEARESLERAGKPIHIRELVAQKNVSIRNVWVQSGGISFGDYAQVMLTVINTSPAPGNGEALGAEDDGTRAYLDWVFTQAGRLSLEGVNLRDAGEKDARLSLQAVYTALLTLTPEEHERLERAQGGEVRRRSALDVLNQYRHLVLLGDPGSGKSTFVNFVALCLAGEALGRSEANLGLLAAPLPDDEGQDQEEQQPWEHGALLPVRIILRDVAARALPGNGQPVTLKHLWDFLKAELASAGLEEYGPRLVQRLQQQGGLLLFDGLDEVPEASQRREQIIQLVEAAAGLSCCHVLVTSRVYAYKVEDWRPVGFEAAVLDAFSAGQIRRFVDHWYASLAQLGAVSSMDEAQGRGELLKGSIFRNPNILALAQRPLLLTLMAGLHAWRGGTLPEKRELLYNETVDLLLDRWQRRTIVRLPDGREEKQPSLEEFLRVGGENVRRVLSELAFEAHRRQPREQVGTADIPERDLVYALLNASPEKESTRPDLLQRYLRERAGLLVARSEKIYTFPHRTFQEYLAACHLTSTEFPEKLAGLACEDPERWREVALLAGARVARTTDTYWSLAEALCLEEPPASAAAASSSQLWGAFLAGQILAESADLTRVAPRNQGKLQRIRRWLVFILQTGSLPVTDRAAAGDTLARLGDPRFDPDRCFLPHSSALAPGGPHPDILGFVPIPAGPFLMGSQRGEKDAYDDEYDQHQLELPDYYLGRAPVTVAQFRSYVSAAQPDLQGLPDLDAPASRPVVRVSWHDALAYCGWLEGRLRELGQERLAGPGELGAEEQIFWRRLLHEGWRVTLPSEAEWEKAARGPLALPPYPPAYPWGLDFDPDCANVERTGLGTTSAVGCFPRGRGAYGLLDQSGNVWEWTRSHFKPYPYSYTDGREMLGAGDDVSRVLRGGSFDYYPRRARCAFRLRYGPDSWIDFGFRAVVVSPVFVSDR